MSHSDGWRLRAKAAAAERVRYAISAARSKRARESGEDDAQCAAEALQSLHFSGARASDAPRALLRPHALPTHSSHTRGVAPIPCAPPFKTEAPGEPGAAAAPAQHAATARARADATVTAPAHAAAALRASGAHAPVLAIRTSPRAAARRVRESEEEEYRQCATLQEEEDARQEEEEAREQEALMKCEAQALEREALEMRAAEELQAVNYAEWNYPLQIIEISFKKTAPLHDHLLAQAALYSEKIYGYVDSQFGRRDRFTLLSQLTDLHNTVTRDIAALTLAHGPMGQYARHGCLHPSQAGLTTRLSASVTGWAALLPVYLRCETQAHSGRIRFNAVSRAPKMELFSPSNFLLLGQYARHGCLHPSQAGLTTRLSATCRIYRQGYRRAHLPSKGQASTSQACRVAFTVKGTGCLCIYSPRDRHSQRPSPSRAGLLSHLSHLPSRGQASAFTV